MPTYQYACTACEHRLEAVQSFADDPLTQCPVCEGRLRKLFGSVGIVFKGSGFYRTDSRAVANGNGSSSDKPGKAEKGEKAAKKDATDSPSPSDKKPDTKAPVGSSSGSKATSSS